MKIERSDENKQTIELIPNGGVFELYDEIWFATDDVYTANNNGTFRRCVRLEDGLVQGFGLSKMVGPINAKVVIE